jgi:hypothetical protein
MNDIYVCPKTKAPIYLYECEYCPECDGLDPLICNFKERKSM